MKIDFISNGELGNLIVTVLNPDDIFEVVKTLEFLEKFLCVNLSYDVDTFLLHSCTCVCKNSKSFLLSFCMYCGV